MRLMLQKNFLRVTESGFLILVLLISTGGPVHLIRLERGIPNEGDPVLRTIWFGIYTVTLLLMATHWKSVIRTAMRDKLLWILIAIALASVLWSSTWWVTLRRDIALIQTTFLGLYMAARYTLNEQLRLLAWTFGLAIILSFVFALAPPNYGVMHDGLHDGRWRGIYIHKNSLGSVMDLSVVSFLLLALSDRSYRWFAWAGFGLSAILILLSGSKTALVVLLTLLALLPLYKALRWRRDLVIVVLIAAVLLGGGFTTLLLSNLETALGALGKDATLSGRTDLWSVLWEMIWNRPLLGYGYGGFWQGAKGEASSYVWQVVGWEAPHGHNGYLDLWIDLGLLGLSTFVIYFLLNILRGVAWARLTKKPAGLWPLTYLTFFFLANLTESVVLTQHNILWILYVATVLSMATQSRSTEYI